MSNIAGAFVRGQAGCRNFIKANGSTPFLPEAGRYHLYVAHACPWCSRCTTALHMKGLQDIISVTFTHPNFIKTSDDPADEHRGWWFSPPTPEFPECSLDPINGFRTVRQIYQKYAPTESRFSVPILFDKHTQTIVSNESSEILRMFSSEFNALIAPEFREIDLCPAHLKSEIDSVNEWVHRDINDGVYKCGFARTQEAYDANVRCVFDALDKAEGILATQRYIVNNTDITEADVRLHATLLRFDEVYHGHFKCNKKTLREYPNLSNYTRDLYQALGIHKSFSMPQIREHYHRSHVLVNPFGIVPIGPGIDFSLPHDRDRFSTEQSSKQAK